MSSLDQQRAHYVWLRVADNLPEDYDKLAKAVPAMIMNNGLMQTLAFCKEKVKSDDSGSDRYHALLSHILEWLHKRSLVEQPDFSTAMKTLATMESPRYRLATEETLDLLRWIRQFAAAAVK